MIGAHAMMGSASDASTPPGQQVWTGTTSATWTVPAGVTSICILTVGAGFAGQSGNSAGFGGGGGALSYANTVSVTPGEVLDGDLDDFMQASLAQRIYGGGPEKVDDVE